MGKSSSSNPAPPADDAVSLHTQAGDRYLDDDAPELQVEDLPTLPSSRSPSVSQESGEEWASAVEDVDDGEGDTSFFGGEAPSESSVGASGIGDTRWRARAR